MLHFKRTITELTLEWSFVLVPGLVQLQLALILRRVAANVAHTGHGLVAVVSFVPRQFGHNGELFAANVTFEFCNDRRAK
jgi:hypothetical protein